MKNIINIVYGEVIHPIKALRYSVAGLVSTFKHESAFRQEIVFGFVHIIALIYFDMMMTQRILLLFEFFVLLAIELLNTAIEAVVNKVSPEYSELARIAKDCGSAAVFIVLVGIFVSWAMVIIWR